MRSLFMVHDSRAGTKSTSATLAASYAFIEHILRVSLLSVRVKKSCADDVPSESLRMCTACTIGAVTKRHNGKPVDTSGN